MRRLGSQVWGIAALPLLGACAAQPGDREAPGDVTQVEIPCEEGEGDGLCAPIGGQSGTEGGGETACDESRTRNPPLGEVLEPLGRSLQDLALSIGAPVTPGRWLATAAPSELSFELGPIVSALETSVYGMGYLCGWELDVQSVTLRTSDGAIDTQLPAVLRRPDFNYPYTVVMDVALGALPQVYLGPAVWSLDEPWMQQWVDAYRLAPRDPGALALVIAVELAGPSPAVRAAAFESGAVLGVWSSDAYELPPGPPLTFTPSEPLAVACDGAAEFQSDTLEYTSFPSAAAALEGMVGTWARCLDNATAEHVGLRILPDGSWQHVVLESGALVARSGFGHEGFVRLTRACSRSTCSRWCASKATAATSTIG
jgi:hypothetical protein